MSKAVIEKGLNKIWYGQRPVPAVLRWFSGLYRWAMRHRSAKSKGSAPIPVVVIGNVVVGGGGKTPVVRAIAQALKSAGHRVVVVARGYGAARSRKTPCWVDQHSDPSTLGDEPCALARYAGLEVVVCADRARAVRAAVAAGADMVVSDDGLQNPHLPHSYTVCVVDGLRGFGNGQLLPAGPLREPIERLSDFDRVWVKGGNFEPNGPFERFHLKPEQLRKLSDGSVEQMRHWQGRSVLAVSGIANPEGFRVTLEALGMVVTLVALPDHHRFAASDLSALSTRLPIVVTEKDAVKLEALQLPQALGDRIYVLSVEASIEPSVVRAVVEDIERIKCDE